MLLLCFKIRNKSVTFLTVIVVAVSKVLCRDSEGSCLLTDLTQLLNKKEKVYTAFLRVSIVLSTLDAAKWSIAILFQVKLVWFVSMWRHRNPTGSCLDIPLALLAGHTPHLIVEASVMCAANERWLLIYQQKLPDKQQGWIIYKVAGREAAFHTLFHAKCRMNSKQAKQFSEAQRPKSINKNGKTGFSDAVWYYSRILIQILLSIDLVWNQITVSQININK